MILKIFFKPIDDSTNDIIIPFSNQKEMNSFIYRTLGDNNKYHDTFSDYSISSIQGGVKYDTKHIIFNTQPYIMVASQNEEFITTLLTNLEKNEFTFFNLKYARCEFKMFKLNEKYDKIITISPIIIKHDNRKISFDNPFFLDELKKNCLEKLRHIGINDETFNVEIRNIEKAKTKLIYVGDVFNISSMISLVVYGKKETRNALYHLGIGGSTGSGFGSIKVYD